MCGIAGCSTIGLSNTDIPRYAEKFIDSLNHRGPDSNGYWHNNQVLLTHSRLAIVDLSENGHQPMVSQSGRFVLTFNGEIYNFREIRKDLEAQGFSFRGHSDTEVILSLIEHCGLVKALKQLTGMFAFALYDCQSRELTLARDRMGEKPLYYGWVNGRFIFGSELKAITACGEKLTLNRQVLNDFLSFGYVPSPDTIFSGIHKLLPGSYLTLSQQKHLNTEPQSYLQPTKYWDLIKASKQKATLTDRETASTELETALEATIANQLLADVPAGCFLSGGVDSSLVTAIAQKVSRNPVKTFTIGFNSESFDESRYAREISRHLGTEHHETYVGEKDVLDLVEAIPVIFDEPFADPSQLPAYLVSRVARQSVTVCLSGDGGDELFAGYNRYASTIKYMRLFRRCPPVFKKALSRALLTMNSHTIERWLASLSVLPGFSSLRQANLGVKAHKFAVLLRSASEKDLYLFLLRFNGFQTSEAPPETTLEKRIDEIFTSDNDFLSSAMLLDQLNYLVDDNLTKVDRSAMANSLETRLPLLDHHLVEMSWRLPSGLKLRDGVTKSPLRDVLYRHIPEQLIDRPKMGFSVPISSWLRKELKYWAEDLLHENSLNSFVDMERYRRAWKEHQQCVSDHGLYLWPVLMLAQWYRANSHYMSLEH